MAISNQGLNFIKNWEGCKLKTYICAAGKPTIGIGHVLLPGEDKKFKDGITEEFAEQMFLSDVKPREASIRSVVRVPLNQRQYDAIVSFVFNIGVQAFKTSTFLKRLNERRFIEASNELLRWCKDDNGKVIKGVLNRREAERKLFLSKQTDKVEFYHV